MMYTEPVSIIDMEARHKIIVDIGIFFTVCRYVGARYRVIELRVYGK